MCTTAAPAWAAAMQSAAIWAGVNGTLSDLLTVSPAPVTAHVMNTELMTGPSFRLAVRLAVPWDGGRERDGARAVASTRRRDRRSSREGAANRPTRTRRD